MTKEHVAVSLLHLSPVAGLVTAEWVFLVFHSELSRFAYFYTKVIVFLIDLADQTPVC